MHVNDVGLVIRDAMVEGNKGKSLRGVNFSGSCRLFHVSHLGIPVGLDGQMYGSGDGTGVRSFRWG